MLSGFKTATQPKIPIMMSKVQREVFERYLYGAKGYFEWGSGGSTLAAEKAVNLQNVASVESDFRWSESISNHCPRTNVIWVDIGPTKDFGWPKEDSLKISYPRYSDVWNMAEQSYDLVMIDGRFRVACCLAVLLNSKDVKTILFDDFKHRIQYHCILPHVDVVEIVDTMLICKPKKNPNREALQELYEQYKYNPE